MNEEARKSLAESMRIHASSDNDIDPDYAAKIKSMMERLHEKISDPASTSVEISDLAYDIAALRLAARIDSDLYRDILNEGSK